MVSLLTRIFCFFLAALGDKIVRDIRPGAAFEPTYIYRLLTVIKSSLSEKVWGALWLLWKLLPRTGGGDHAYVLEHRGQGKRISGKLSLACYRASCR